VGKLAGAFDKPAAYRQCRLADLLDVLDAEDQEALIEAILDVSLSVSFISEQVRDTLEQTLARSVISRHRGRVCDECVRRGHVFERLSQS
jgi:hypothetical protein